MKIKTRGIRLLNWVASIGLIVGLVMPLQATASQLTSRKLTLGSSAPSASTSFTLNFTVPSSTAVQSISAQVCTTASGSCTTPAGFSVSGSTLGSFTGLPGSWTVNTASAGTLRASTTTSTAPSATATAIFNNVTNPSASNTAFYVRVTTFSDTAWSTSIDTGTVAAATSAQIVISGTMDESLVFCAGTSITGQNCGTIAGTGVSLGTLSTTSAAHATSVMAASTNAVGGYVITVSGTTLTCGTCSGSPTVAAMGTQSQNGSAAASSTGTAQFGLNLRSNTSLGGADLTGSGTGTYGTNYGTADTFRFFSGDTVASAGASTNANAFTVDYIANVPGSQAAGSYTTTLTYICTATF